MAQWLGHRSSSFPARRHALANYLWNPMAKNWLTFPDSKGLKAHMCKKLHAPKKGLNEFHTSRRLWPSGMNVLTLMWFTVDKYRPIPSNVGRGCYYGAILKSKAGGHCRFKGATFLYFLDILRHLTATGLPLVGWHAFFRLFQRRECSSQCSACSFAHCRETLRNTSVRLTVAPVKRCKYTGVFKER